MTPSAPAGALPEQLPQGSASGPDLNCASHDLLQGLTTLHLCLRGFSFLEAEGAKRFSSLQRLQDLQLDNVMMSPATLAGLLAALPQLQALSLSIKFATEVQPSTAKDMSSGALSSAAHDLGCTIC